MSYSGFAMPPYYATQAKVFQRMNEGRVHVRGSLRITGKETPARLAALQEQVSRGAANTRVTIDPVVTDPFDDLPFLLTVAWGGALAPFVLVLGVAGWRRRRGQRSTPRDRIRCLLAGLVITELAIFHYGRVSLFSSLVMWTVVVVLPIVLVAKLARLYRQGARSESLVFGAVLAVVATMHVPGLAIVWWNLVGPS